MTSSFYALILRMKHIQRWGLMRNTFSDNLAEHSLDTAVISHALCLIGNTYFGKNLDADRCAVLALFHDAGEIITGDMPTPVKYYNESLKTLYKQVEKEAQEQLVRKLPDPLAGEYRTLLSPSGEDAALFPYLKAADKLSAYIKCVQETQSGNREFQKALESQLAALKALALPEADFFMEHFLPAFSENLDRQQISFEERKEQAE